MAVNGSLPAGTVTEGEGGVGHGSALLLSAAERQFVTKGVEEGVRPDGRERLASRAIQIETGVIPGAFGSAQVTCGGTKVIAAVKAELVAPLPSLPGGRVEVCVTCNRSASPALAGARGEEAAAELTFAMNRLMQGGLPESTRERLKVSSSHCWLLLVDASVHAADGAMLDVVSSTVYAALADTRLPQVLMQEGKDGVAELEIMAHDGDVKGMQVEHVPVFVTLSQVGRRYVADASSIEEACATVTFCVAVNSQGKVCCSHKPSGRALDPAQAQSMLLAAVRVGRNRLSLIDAYFKQK